MNAARARRLAGAAAAALLAACGGGDGSGKVAVPGVSGAQKTSAALRAERRLFDGAPPVIPHADFGADCISCHTEAGISVPGTGFAPPAPHANVTPPSAMSRCQQCHAWKLDDGEFRANAFAGLRQDLRRGKRLHELAPPVIPHQVLLRENCRACHDGPAAREEIRCPHPERERCTQCHVEQAVLGEFAR
jgi:nitrate reductase cytochrome c-type subunit